MEKRALFRFDSGGNLTVHFPEDNKFMDCDLTEVVCVSEEIIFTNKFLQKLKDTFKKDIRFIDKDKFIIIERKRNVAKFFEMLAEQIMPDIVLRRIMKKVAKYFPTFTPILNKISSVNKFFYLQSTGIEAKFIPLTDLVAIQEKTKC